MGSDGIDGGDWRRRPLSGEGDSMANQTAGPRWILGGRLLHRHRLSQSLLFEVSPVPALFSPDGAGALSPADEGRLNGSDPLSWYSGRGLGGGWFRLSRVVRH